MHATPLAGAGVLAAVLAMSGAFDSPASTFIREKITGNLIAGTTTITPETGDQIGAFAKTKIVGLFAYTSASPGFSILVYGDVPSTTEVEGAKQGERITFRYFDESTNTEIPLQAVNSQGETTNINYQGQELPPIELPGLDLTPTRVFDLRPGASSGDGDGDGDGGGDGGGTPGKYDVDGDGEVTIEDAAMVLRIVVGASAAGSAEGDPDVDGDDKVTTRDAIEILRNR